MAIIGVILVTPKVGAKHELLFRDGFVEHLSLTEVDNKV
jgi:hypothetical protein